MKDKVGGKQHCLMPFVGSNLGVQTFLKKMEHQNGMRYNRGLRHLSILCIEVSRKFYVKPVCLLILFLVIKGILKAFSFIPCLLNFSDLPNYGSNLRKRCTLRLLSKCLLRSTLLPIGGKVPKPLIPSHGLLLA